MIYTFNVEIRNNKMKMQVQFFNQFNRLVNSEVEKIVREIKTFPKK